MTSVMMVRIHCTGVRKDGNLCDHLLLYVDSDLLENKVIGKKQAIKCPKCGKVEDFARWV